MKKTPILIILALLLLTAFIAPTSAFSISSNPSYQPDILYIGTEVNAHITVMYNENELSNSHADLVYQTELENAIWDIKLYQGENDIPIIQYEKTERSGRISWFDIYQTNAKSYVEFTLIGKVPNYKSEIKLFSLFETTSEKLINKYESTPIPVYDKEQSKADFAKLKEELNVQNNLVNELSQFTEVTALYQMINNYSKTLRAYETTQLIPKETYDILVANLNSIKQSVINYQRAHVENNLKQISTYVQNSAYYNDYIQLYEKLNNNDFSDNIVTKSQYLVAYVIQEQQNKENLKLSIIVLIVIGIIGTITILLMIRNKNRKQLDEIF